jgi:hypothetical protein
MSRSGTGKRKRAQAIDSIVSAAKEEWSLRDGVVNRPTRPLTMIKSNSSFS